MEFQNEYSHATSPMGELSSLLIDYDENEEKLMDMKEDILNKNLERLIIIPIDPKYQLMFELYKKQFECLWTAEDIDFSRDLNDFQNLDLDTQHFIKMILAFFAGADSIVVTNIRTQFDRITVKEAQLAYGFQQMMENVHGEVYGQMLLNIVKDPTERQTLSEAFKTVDSIRMMIEWAQNWTNSRRRIAFTVMAFIIFEGLMFSGAFAAIFWLKRHIGQGRMDGLIQSNNFIARDEGLHTIFGCTMYDHIIHRLSKEEADTMIGEAVVIIKKFVNDAIRIDLIGMSVDHMNDYVEYCADRLLVYTGYSKIYNKENPFPFMETIGYINKDNFFEKRSSDYQRAHNQNNNAEWEFKVLDDY